MHPRAAIPLDPTSRPSIASRRVPAGARTARDRERRDRRRARRVGEDREAGRAEPLAWVVPVLGAVFLLSGAAGLVHEVVWARLLGHLFGATSLAVSTVLAAFMGGLALGSHLVGSRTARLGDRPRVYALLEIGIGLSALVIPLVLALVQPVYGALWRRCVSEPHLPTVEGMLAGSATQLLYHREGPTATVAVARWTQGGRRSLFVNGRVNASDRRDDM